MESSQQFQPQQPEAESPDLTSGIATTNIDESSDETSEKNPTMNNRLENPNNIQTQHVTAEDDTINEEPAATNFAAEIPRITSGDKDSQSQSNEAEDDNTTAQNDERGSFTIDDAFLESLLEQSTKAYEDSTRHEDRISNIFDNLF